MKETISDNKWLAIFSEAIDVLGEGEFLMEKSQSWCSWTTFDRLKCWDCGYWGAGLPKKSDLSITGINDGSVWGQPFEYSSIAHIIFPKRFCTEMGIVKEQNIQKLKEKLMSINVPHNMNEYLLEIKQF
ncbi:hypothetical protein KCM76_25045 [Zooshikella marina]|uniref:hypothetical protein n=1 Tax=Zooshikella ganghwensis TaxID=202772 RepID=UPI001BB02FB0|nr:hypothetical protein [Zooshikella ganghwensis]MBU2709287.1 hypothetical protein [Zooshikella ganghwensis]